MKKSLQPVLSFPCFLKLEFCFGNNWEKYYEAYDKGDFQTAITYLTPLPEKDRKCSI